MFHQRYSAHEEAVQSGDAGVTKEQAETSDAKWMWQRRRGTLCELCSIVLRLLTPTGSKLKLDPRLTQNI